LRSVALKSLLFLLYSNLFIAWCAAMMGWETLHRFDPESFLLRGSGHGWTGAGITTFIFGATLLAYNIHWLAGLRAHHHSYRYRWTYRHRFTVAAMALVGMAITWGWLPDIYASWRVILPAILVTALYTLPKINAFRRLRSIAAGKTFLLAASWTYVTALMPMLLTETPLSTSWTGYVAGRFFLVYAICLLFDHRDVEQDLAEGLVTLPSRLTRAQLRLVFMTSLLLSAISTLYPCMLMGDCTIISLTSHLSPVIILCFLFSPAMDRFSAKAGDESQQSSDFFYYGLLDFLMMLSALLSFLFHF
jgi:1,4-dihydroxy-2-naphthoate octaprenyltransferase